MKKLLYIVPLLLGMTLASCKYDDSGIWDKLNEYGESIKDHENRISTLEELCKKMNTNLSALQTIVEALEKNDYVTNVSPIREDGEIVGYTISFSKSDTITIYHGQDGTDGLDGVDGKDGYTPQIGVMKDLDEIYYWTVDGEWLLDGKGNKIKAVGVDGTNGVNGENGTDGEDGANGVDGVTPRLKIENDYWYVSYDNGTTWELLGKATGEDGKDGVDGEDGADGEDGKDGENGTDGEDGKDGDNIFLSVTQDDECVYFNMADGTMITLPKHDKENIQFEDLRVKAICCKNWDTNNNGELSYAEAAAVETIGTKFKGNTNIIAFTELKYFTSLTEIPEDAFNGCTALWKVVLPENVQTIKDGAFYGCSCISNISIPDQVTRLGNRVFANCSSLLVAEIGCNVQSIGILLFADCEKITSVKCKALTPPVLDTKEYCGSTGYGDKNTNCMFSYSTKHSGSVGTNTAYHEIKSSETIKLYVSNSSVNAYKNSDGWKVYADFTYGYDFEE